MKKICPLCGTENDENARFCKECNEPLYDLKKEDEEAKEKIRSQKTEKQGILKNKKSIKLSSDKTFLKINKIIVIPFILILVLAIGIYGFNYISLQSKMNYVLKNDPRNEGIEVSVRYSHYINPSIIVYDLEKVSNTKSMADVFRVFMQFSEKVQSKDFNIVELSYMGKKKFKIKGDYYRKLGQEYNWQNPAYTIRTFPENLMLIDGYRAYPEWTGGLIGVLGKQMEDFNDFNMKWYLEDIVNEKE
jgi:hypothetical protein